MSALPLLALKEGSSEKFPARGFHHEDDALKQWRDLQYLMYCQLDRLRSGAGDAQIDMMLLASDMAEWAEQSNDLHLAEIVLSLSDCIARIGPTATGFQMVELRSILAAMGKNTHLQQ